MVFVRLGAGVFFPGSWPRHCLNGLLIGTALDDIWLVGEQQVPLKVLGANALLIDCLHGSESRSGPYLGAAARAKLPDSLYFHTTPNTKGKSTTVAK